MMVRSTALAAAVLVLAVAASGGVPGAAASQGGGSVVAVEFTGTTNSSAQPSNCTYGNNVGGVCPPTPPGAGR